MKEYPSFYHFNCIPTVEEDTASSSTLVDSTSTLSESGSDVLEQQPLLLKNTLSEQASLSSIAKDPHELKYDYGAISKETLIDKSSSLGAAMNLVNAMMGTGIIGLPLALHLCGFWLGVAFSVLIACLSCLTMHITIVCGMKTQTTSLVSLVERLVGPFGSSIMNFIVFFHTAGTAISYYLLLGDTLPSLIAWVLPNYPALANRTIVILLFGLCFTLPLSLSRSTAKFAKWSALSVVLLFLMLIGVLVRSPNYYEKIPIENKLTLSEPMFQGLAIMSLAFGCAQNLFSIHDSIRDKSPSNWLFTCSLAIGIAFVINMVFAIILYLCFGKGVQANVFLNFPINDVGIQLAKMTLGLFMVLSIPLCVYPCRESVMMMIYGTHYDYSQSTDKQHFIVTIVVFSIILYFGATLVSLGKIFSLIGGFSTTILGFFLPGLAFMYLFDYKGNRFLFLTSFVGIVLALPVIYFSIKLFFYE
ncbi:transmembrane amino acid transporter protein-domain-containing protein [Gilbertella persicaria]|uniref:transmembrane amino acid transporter protein-domain-containing protein n=1 Tax=Gilbertella persicaria TaxID=101096 RepID=UPI00222109B6|nr:transmembrane amino acid transporter protein-domain-containing protein [Gilbertella persicaria]KAI8078081.1 transmembrane amino acid transporter protein-domain-containing protein [Gilbertella persicaria]